MAGVGQEADKPRPIDGKRDERNCLSDKELIELCSTYNINNFTFFLNPTSPLKANNPYVLRNDIMSNITKDKSVSYPYKTRAGSIVMTAFSAEAAMEILAITTIQNTPVQTKLSYDNILSDFVLTNVDTEIQLDEIIADLQAQNIVIFHICRFAKMINGTLQPLKTIKFRSPTPMSNFQTKVFVGVMIHPIKLFEERPRQCQRCWVFGHGSKTCRANIVCKKCAENHDSETCQNIEEIKCRNCKGSHVADDEACQTRKREVEILLLKRENKISYREAKEVNFNSYAAAAKKGNHKQQITAINNAEVNLVDLQSNITKMIQESVQEIIQQTIAEQITKAIEPLVEMITTMQLKQNWIMSQLKSGDQQLTYESLELATNDLENQLSNVSADHVKKIINSRVLQRNKRSGEDSPILGGKKKTVVENVLPNSSAMDNT